MIEFVIDSFAEGASFWLDRAHSIEKRGIVCLAICSCMHAPVAARAEGNYEPNIIRSAVADPSDVVGFEIGRAICTKKGGLGAASLAVAVSALEHIGAHIAAAPIDGPLAGAGYLTDAGGSDGRGSELFEWARSRRLAFCLFGALNVLHRAELEDKGRSHGACTIGGGLGLNVFANPFTVEAQAPIPGNLAEQEEGFAFPRMCCDCFVASGQLHVSDLTFAEVLKDAVFTQAIGVAVLASFIAGYDDDDGMPRWGDDAALLLATKLRMNVATAVVGAPAFETPRHVVCAPRRIAAELERALGDRSYNLKTSTGKLRVTSGEAAA